MRFVRLKFFIITDCSYNKSRPNVFVVVVGVNGILNE